MITPQEVQVWYILPAIRRHFAISLKKSGLKQKDIAALLNLTESAVSQYLKGKRGEEVDFSKEIKKEISKSAQVISKKKTMLNRETQKLLKKIMENKFICTVCNDHAHTDKNCEICYT